MDGIDTVLLPYTHFSVLMRPDKRLAAVTGLGIDGGKLMDLGRSGIPWKLDPRLPEDQQTGARVYAGSDIDRGHLVRRASAVWGDTHAEAAQANEDTFHYTNAAPQAAKFNQGLELWLGLESNLLDNAADHRRRLLVFTGPVFTGHDPVYRGVGIPLRFFKSPYSSTTPRWEQPGTSWTRHPSWQTCRTCHGREFRTALPRSARSGPFKSRSGTSLH